MKKLLCIIIMTSMLTGIFAGCSGQVAPVGQPAQQTTEETAPAESEPEVVEEPAEIEEVVEEIPEEPVFDLYTNTISDELKAKAAAYPDIDEALPNWRGVAVVDKASFCWPWANTFCSGYNVDKLTDEEIMNAPNLTWFDETTIQEIKEAGYNFVRVYLDDRFFFTDHMDLEYVSQTFFGSIDTVCEEQYLDLDKLIGWCIDRDITVCLDLHNTPGGLMTGGDEETTREPLFTPGSEEQDILVRFWEILANRYADIDTKALSFNLYNEPPRFLTEDNAGREMDYIDLMNRAAEKVQAVTPDRLIVIDTMEYSTLGFEHLDELKVNNLLVAFHLYSDQSTDHDIDHMDVAANTSEVKSRLKYYNDWAKEHNVRWMLQEYGCSNNIRQQDQVEYLTFLTDLCREYGVSFCMHAFNCTDFFVCSHSPEKVEWLTPDAEYTMTSCGNKINMEIVDITSKK